jgi:hypothetical protein
MRGWGRAARFGACAVAACALLAAAGGAVARSAPTRSATAGTQLWVARDARPGQLVKVSPDGSRLFRTGGGRGPRGSLDYGTAAYVAATGAELWFQRYNGPANGTDTPQALAVSPDGTKVFVTGQSRGLASDDDWATFAYDAATGARLWARRDNGPANGSDHAIGLTVAPDGSKIFITGISPSAVGSATTAAYNASTGTRLWVKRHLGYNVAIAGSRDGSSVFVTGYIPSPQAYQTIAYNAATGAQRWVQVYDGPAADGDDNARAVAVAPDGSKVFVTGETIQAHPRGGATVYGGTTIAYSAMTGAQLWRAAYTGGFYRGASFDSVAVTPDGARVVVGGIALGANQTGFVTAALDASTGRQAWAQVYSEYSSGPGSKDYVPRGLALRPDSSAVVVTGYGPRDGTADDYATLAYDVSTGARLWLARYDYAGGYDNANAVDVSPDGSKVYVTGGSSGAAATIAYSSG